MPQSIAISYAVAKNLYHYLFTSPSNSEHALNWGSGTKSLGKEQYESKRASLCASRYWSIASKVIEDWKETGANISKANPAAEGKGYWIQWSIRFHHEHGRNSGYIRRSSHLFVGLRWDFVLQCIGFCDQRNRSPCPFGTQRRSLRHT